jgi:hypothetical protein
MATPTFTEGFNNFVTGLGGKLFPTTPGADPAAAQAAQRQALLLMGLGMMGSSSRPGATLGGSLFQGYQGAAQNYAGAMDTAFRSTLAKNEQERQQKQEERLQKAQERSERTQAGGVAQRLSTGLSGASDPMAYWNLMRTNPDAQAALQQFGLPEPQTPEEAMQIAQQLGAVGQVSGPVVPRQPVQLKAIVGPDGKPMLVPEEMAVGQQPAYAPRGKGMSVTMPDGTVVEMGGDTSGVGPQELTKPTVNKLQETIIQSSDRLDRLNQSLAQYSPEFLRASGLAKVWTTRVKDFAGLNVSEDQRAFLSQYAEFQSNLKNDLSLYLNQLSGAAISPAEYDRLSKSAPTGNELSPAEFEAKARATIKNASRAMLRANWAIKNGIGIQSAEQLAKIMPLEGIDAVYEQRANQIWQELGGTPEAKAEAVRRANQEFGLAR